MRVRGKQHEFRARLVWEGDAAVGTPGYEVYTRNHRLVFEGKPGLAASAAAAFRGDPGRLDPEDLFLGAIAGCHLLTYLSLCARQGVDVLAYEDEVTGSLALDPDGGGRFTEVVLHPRVRIAAASDRELAARLHGEAHARCFIAQSCSVPIRHEATIEQDTVPGDAG